MVVVAQIGALVGGASHSRPIIHLSDGRAGEDPKQRARTKLLDGDCYFGCWSRRVVVAKCLSGRLCVPRLALIGLQRAQSSEEPDCTPRDVDGRRREEMMSSAREHDLWTSVAGRGGAQGAGDARRDGFVGSTMHSPHGCVVAPHALFWAANENVISCHTSGAGCCAET